jgi:hypothetical protein
MEFKVLVHSAIHPATGMYSKSFQTKTQLHATSHVTIHTFVHLTIAFILVYCRYLAS